MKTATIREAQHHLSKLMEEVEKGQEIILTRRGKRVGKLVPMEEPGEKKIDWAAWAEGQREYLETMPMIDGSALGPDREGYRW